MARDNETKVQKFHLSLFGFRRKDVIRSLEQLNAAALNDRDQLMKTHRDAEKMYSDLVCLTREKEELSAKITALTEKHAAETAELEEKHAAEIAALTAEHTAETEALTASHTAEIEALTASHAAETEVLTASHAAETEVLTAESTAEKEKLTAEFAAKTAELTEQISVLGSALEERDSAANALSLQLSALQEKLDAALAAQKDIAPAADTPANPEKAAAEQELAELKKECEALRTLSGEWKRKADKYDAIRVKFPFFHRKG